MELLKPSPKARSSKKSRASKATALPAVIGNGIGLKMHSN